MLEEQLNKINDLGFKFKTSKDDKEKDNIENDVKNIISDLKKNAIERFQSESDIKMFLDNIVRFNNYSFNNQLLIFLQKPDANYVSAFRTFSKLGYKINKGAKGIKIFIPNFYNIAKIKQEDGSFTYKPFFLLNQYERKIYNDENDNTISFHKQKLAGFSLGNVFDATDTTMPLDAINEELNPVLNNNSDDGIMDCFIKTIMKTESTNIEPHAFVMLNNEQDSKMGHILFDVENLTLIEDKNGKQNTVIGLYLLTNEEYDNFANGLDCTPISLYETIGDYYEVGDKRTYGNIKPIVK